MIDVDRAARIKSSRLFAFCGSAICLAVIVFALMDVIWPAYVVLCAGAATFMSSFLVFTAELRNLTLSDADLRKRDRDG